jgi:hypothetical protein
VIFQSLLRTEWGVTDDNRQGPIEVSDMSQNRSSNINTNTSGHTNLITNRFGFLKILGITITPSLHT